MAQQDILSTLRKLISGMDESLVIFDQNGSVLHASYDLEKLLEKSDIVGTTIFEHLTYEHERVEHFLRDLNTSKYMDLQVVLKKSVGSFTARMRLASWKVADNEFVVLGSLVDSTQLERKRRDLLRKTLTIELLSKSKKIRNGKLHDAIYEILEMSSKAVGVTRVSAWLFDESHEHIECIGNYDTRLGKMIPQESLPVIEMPTYFMLFETEKIILAANAQTSPYTSELNDSYLVPNGIVSLMDIPIRSEGSIIGVICFEQVKQTRNWTLNDQKFGLIAAQMTSLAVETHKRKIAQQELEAALRQQKRLLVETNHRIVNNLKITSSLLNIQVNKARDSYHKNLMLDSVNRVQSILNLHEMLTEGSKNLRVSLNQYINKLVQSLRDSLSFPQKQLQLLTSIDSCEVKSSLAICIGIIINEAVLNAYKHAFEENEIGVIRIDFQMHGPKGVLEISDNGKGIKENRELTGSGVEIIRGMVEHLNGNLDIDGTNGMKICVSFSMR
ncbi:histidine kinase dimerization/phosphoacceptor domain -containing protein [Fluviicola taffensis]|uniref:histidine kinase n=1 Tax=Fluviicola taffensis (strain DSM 16823 / NCIMB 13979 / RW262) TaxID=755732 RepID=F2IC90_FLUTR|nr:histidine kinase dimerization/phosphoacceptor domain -containing protein [Fluviicola taffensis]AEA44336.1 signal transduction histidine kinase [Fluviicola taffensis DSM 16823]